MKNLFLLVAAILLTVVTASAQQIGDCTQSGTRIKVYDVNGRYFNELIASSGATLAGFTSNMIVVSQGDRVKIYGADCRYKTEFIIPSGYYVKNVAGNNILATDGRRTKIYDSNGRYLTERIN